ncbi:MAG: ABC transporter ATP-binding protein [Bdellovibrionales bacterium GWC1_52_8]|nr:MAG: ABC transporter ATP-binding protein [Bdellovibrionales bacterium GWB1_52_6]OFZ05538.1 MAG: ABC transporter ATP-binding protein [Bdellovibrionales bacterium GWA1_52_35]OFZ33027.1 MAG: ABC transporter ATP-binding protein [Bdellovibrionales bacterium GWC1_52_8]HCM39094.1 ABC transporter ATP-binding protein [Bdellovibrionales bacterium]
MISTAGISLGFGAQKLFDDVNIKFVPGNCYGLIGANGAGKSTFLKILSGEISPNKGTVTVTPGERISFLRQDHFTFDDVAVLNTVILGEPRLSKLIAEKEALYLKTDFTDADGVRAGELEGLFAELRGWEAESDAAVLLAGLGIGTELHDKKMRELRDTEKLKVLLAQALFGQPDILLLDEPTNHLDVAAIRWLEEFLLVFDKTVIVVSHDRHFLNQVCTHMADIDFGRIQLYTGNYDFWYQSSQLALKQAQDKKKRTEDKAEELKAFIARFSANASKSRQATSRKKQLEKLTLEDIQPSTRKYPFVGFKAEREAGDQLLRVENLSKTIDGVRVLDRVSFTLRKGDKVVFIGETELAVTTLFRILIGEIPADNGSFTWGVTTSRSFFPKENAKYFDGVDLTLIDWLRQYSPDQNENFVRGFLGRMLFSGDEATKKTKVLSGGERVRCMLSRMMLTEANVLILDGPTNHLDLESITSVNDGLIRFSGTVLFSSHDQQFIQTIASRVIEVGSKGVSDHDKNYEEYLLQKLGPSMPGFQKGN